MNSYCNLKRTALVGLLSLILGIGTAHAGSGILHADSEYLNRWQATYDSLRGMTPKWGKQGVDAFKASLDAGVPIVFLDVRTPKKWEKGVIKGALLISLNNLPTVDSLARLPEDRNTIIGIYCKGGHRSALALALLNQLGYKNAINMVGGMTAWVKAGYPVVAASR